MSEAVYPCKHCGASPRNTVHKNVTQYGYHPWEEEDRKESTNRTVWILSEDNGVGEGRIFGVYDSAEAAEQGKKDHPLAWSDFWYEINEYEVQS